jgi:hypothetical protein
MLFNSRTVAWVALATLIASTDLVSASSLFNIKARHSSLHRRFEASTADTNNAEKLVASTLTEQPVVKKIRKRNSGKKCPAKKSSSAPVNNAEMGPPSSSSSSSLTKSQSRLDIINSMYAFGGFVYSLEVNLSSSLYPRIHDLIVIPRAARARAALLAISSPWLPTTPEPS